jgi:hypothetical protein
MSEPRVSYIITDQNITVNFNGQTHIVPRSDVLSDRLIDAIRNDRKDEIPNLVSVAKRIENLSAGTFTVKNGKIFVKGQQVSSALGNKILKFSDEGLPFEPLVKFAENLQLNPSFRAVNELFLFLEKNDHPITDNGNFIAYKRVRGNFTDIHSGTFDNSVGKTVEMPRNQVNEDATQTCSYGLHVANWDYAHNHFASHDPGSDVMLEVEVNPADVVAVPTDYNQSKMRVCKYVVLGVVDQEHSSDVSIRYTATSTEENYIDDEEDEDDDDDFYDEDESSSSDEEDYDDESDEDEDEYPYEDELE